MPLMSRSSRDNLRGRKSKEISQIFTIKLSKSRKLLTLGTVILTFIKQLRSPLIPTGFFSIIPTRVTFR